MAPHNGQDGDGGEEEEEEEEDYMSMIISEPPQRETFAQKKRRQQREAEARAHIPSKAERAAQEAARREEALAKSTLDPTNKGYQMMIKLGFKPGEGLGRRQQQQPRGEGEQEPNTTTSQENTAGSKSQDGSNDLSRSGLGSSGIGIGTTRKEKEKGEEEEKETSTRIEPLNLIIKEDRGGIGLDSERKRKFLQEAEQHGASKRRDADEGDYRDRVRMERELRRLEAQVYAAQKVAEGLDSAPLDHEVDVEEEKGRKKTPPTTRRVPLKINVLYRGMVRDRETRERDLLARRALESSLPTTTTTATSSSFFSPPRRLPGYIDTDLDGDDKQALQGLPFPDSLHGRKSDYTHGGGAVGDDSHIFFSNVEQELSSDEDGEGEGEGGDAELDAFNALEPSEKLSRLVMYMRETHWYCFWCKARYETREMEGCPGVREEDHD